MARLYRSIRVLVALGAGTFFGTLLYGTRSGNDVLESAAEVIGRMLVGANVASEFIHGALIPASLSTAVGIIVLLVYKLFALALPRQQGGSGETHCRKCGYILRGLTEPRCPECGERI